MTKPKYKKLITHHKCINAMAPTKLEYVVILTSFLLVALFTDLNLETSARISASIFTMEFIYSLCWIIDTIYFAIKKKKFEKTEEYNNLTQEQKEEYTKEMEKE